MTTKPDLHANFAISTVAVAPAPAATGLTMTVAAGSGGSYPAAPFNVGVGPANALWTPANSEIVRVTSKGTGDNWTIVRTQEASAARTIVVGDIVALTVTAKTLTDIEVGAQVEVLFDQTLAVAGPSLDTGANGIPAGFAAIEVFVTARSTFPGVAVTTTSVGLQLNGDTAANYFYQDIYGSNVTPNAGDDAAGGDNLLRSNMPAATAGAGVAGKARYLFHNYDSVNFLKEALLVQAMMDPTAAANGRARMAGALWNSTAAINQVAFVDRSGNNLVAGSRMTILGYGRIS